MRHVEGWSGGRVIVLLLLVGDVVLRRQRALDSRQSRRGVGGDGLRPRRQTSRLEDVGHGIGRLIVDLGRVGDG